MEYPKLKDLDERDYNFIVDLANLLKENPQRLYKRFLKEGRIFFDEEGRIEDIRLGRLSLIDLPKSLTNLEKLVNLDLEYNSFRKVPEDISLLYSLSSLSLSDNMIDDTYLLDKIPTNLGYLNLSRNPIKTLYKPRKKPKKLKILLMQSCYLSEVPEAILELENLMFLNLSYNPIRRIPISIKNLKKLKGLRIAYCNLTSLPKSLAELENLMSLDISHNTIKKLPKLTNPHLSHIHLEGTFLGKK